MFRTLLFRVVSQSTASASFIAKNALRNSASTGIRLLNPTVKNFTTLTRFTVNPVQSPATQLLRKPEICVENTTTRTVTKISIRKGKRKSVKAVRERFYRLHWGGWIRTKAGRQKKLWKKSSARKRRLRQHVFCNSTQSRMLDKMVGRFWRKPKYFVDDPYEPYHTREECRETYRKPKPYFPPEEM